MNNLEAMTTHSHEAYFSIEAEHYCSVKLGEESPCSVPDMTMDEAWGKFAARLNREAI